MNDRESEIFRAVFRGDVNLVQELLLQSPSTLDAVVPQTNDSLLHVAAGQGHIKIAEMLIERGLYIDLTDNQGLTPLQRAIWFDQTKMVHHLLILGANPNHSSKDGRFPLQFAAFRSNTDIAADLLDKGADITIRDKNGATVVMIAESSGKQEMAEFLGTVLGINQQGIPVGLGCHTAILKAIRVMASRREQGIAVTEQDYTKALADALNLPWPATREDCKHSEPEPNQLHSRLSAESKSPVEYKKVYVRFPKPLERHDSQDFDAWSGYLKSEALEFANDLEAAILEMLKSYFMRGWRLDGPYSKAVNFDSETKGMLGGLLGNTTTYKGFWARLRRTE